VDLGQIGWAMWSGFAWLRIGTGDELLWMRWWTFGFWRHGVVNLLSSFLCSLLHVVLQV
jgi:hypothetical protein